MGLGISLITKSKLGTSPISSAPYILSMIFPFTFGQFTFLLSVICLLIQIMLLKKDFPKIQFLQIIVGIFFSFFIDFGMFLLSFVHPTSYIMKIVFVLLGCSFLALGIYLEVKADVITNPGEGLVRIISDITGKKFGTIKTAFDCTLLIIAIIISLVTFGTLKGLREGTIISAILVGNIIKAINKIIKYFQLEEKINKIIYG